MRKARFGKGTILAALVTLAGTSWMLAQFLAHPGTASESQPRPIPAAASPVPPDFDSARPLTVVVRGWLWDPESRVDPPALSYFPDELNVALRERYGVETQLYQYKWSRLPKDLPAASRDFAVWARALAERAAASGRCVNFVGHSAGAVIVYSAAARGVPMGFMGTLGLPTMGRFKPGSVTQWTNFYTVDTHDPAGTLWGKGMAADRNIQASAPHKEMWSSRAVIEGAADGIATAWTNCSP
jgi:hypothetical protein